MTTTEVPILTSNLTRSMGSEVHDIQIGEALSDSVVEAIRRTLAERSVLLFRKQSLSPEAHIAFSRRLGSLEEHVLQNFCLPGHPEIFVVSNIKESGKHIGAYGGSKTFHSDLAYLAEPSMGSVFHCLECPSQGGETAFVSMFAAYDALPEDRRRWLAGKRIVFDYVWDYARRHPTRPALTEAQKRKTPPVAHPCVRAHPETGRKALFISPTWVRNFEGMSDEESKPIIDELCAFATDPRFTYFHTWRPGDVLIRENRSSMHKACPFDEENSRRLMHRTTICGDRPLMAT